MISPAPEHGTPARYMGTRTGSRPPCRCRKCTDAHNRACRARELAHLNGTPPRVPAGPVTDHVHALLGRGLSCTQIAIAAGVSIASVANAMNAKNATFNRSTAEKILAARPRIVRPTDRVPATGTRRRIQALYTLGHGSKAIAEHTGMSPYSVQVIANRPHDIITAETYLAIRKAYRVLVTKPGTSAKAKRSARINGWHPPTAWGDDIDNPAATPDIDDGEPELGRNDTAALRRAEIEHLDQFDLPVHEIAARLDMAPGYVRDIIRELHTGQKRDRRQVAA